MRAGVVHEGHAFGGDGGVGGMGRVAVCGAGHWLHWLVISAAARRGIVGAGEERGGLVVDGHVFCVGGCKSLEVL